MNIYLYQTILINQTQIFVTFVRVCVLRACIFQYSCPYPYQPKKFWGGNEVLPKFCDVCPNHDFRVHFGYDKKIVWVSQTKTNFVLKSWWSLKKKKKKKKKSSLKFSLLIFDFRPKIKVFSKKKKKGLHLNLGYYFLQFLIITSLNFLTLPKFFISLPEKLWFCPNIFFSLPEKS